MTRDILCNDPVAIAAVQAVWQHLEPAPDGFVGVGDAPRVRAPDQALDQGRYLHSLLLADLEIPDNIDGGTGGDEGDPVHFLLGQFPVGELDDILAPHVPAGDVGSN